MKPYPILTPLLALLPSAALADKMRISAGVWCETRKPDLPNYTDDAFNKLLDTWHTSFGYGGGTLNHGYGGKPTYQAVCCGEWCLYVEHGYDENDYSWGRDSFDFAAAQIRHYSPGRGFCETNMSTLKGFWKDTLMLKMVRKGHGIAWGSEHTHGKITPAMDLFGDTCAGAPPYNGPDW